MTLTFLGTGTSQGVPVITCGCKVCRSSDTHNRRLRTSALLSTAGGRNILFDIGPDFRQQMLRADVGRLDAVLVTHAHRDHVAGLDDIRPFNYVQRGAIDIYGNDVALHALRRDYGYIFGPHDYPGLPEAELHDVGREESFTAAGELVTPIHVMHKDLPILGYRVGRMAYITDANYIPPSEMEKLKGLDVLVLNALRLQHHWSHYSLAEALEVIDTLRPQRAYLTHVSHELGLHDEVQASLPEGVSLAYDGLAVEV